MAKRKAPHKGNFANKGGAGSRRISPLKPGLSGAKNWANAQVRAAGYSRKHRMRLATAGVALTLSIFTGALWLGGYMPTLQASGANFTKQRLMNMGFVVKYVDVVGEGRISEPQVRAALGVQAGDYLFDMDITNAQARVQSLSWVENAVVRRLWPNRVVVHINERRPFAMWQDNGKFNIVDPNGVTISAANSSDFYQLPMIVGKGAEKQAHGFLKILSTFDAVQNRMESIVYVSERRWDVILNGSGLRIMLPEENPQAALQNLAIYHEKYNILDRDLERIDMRVKGRLFLRPSSKAKEKRA